MEVVRMCMLHAYASVTVNYCTVIYASCNNYLNIKPQDKHAETRFTHIQTYTHTNTHTNTH